MIQAVIFDIDNTLYDYDAAHAVAFQALSEYAQHTLGVDSKEFEALHQRANQLLQARTGGDCAAIHNRLLRYQILLEELGKPIPHAPVMERLYWNTLIDAAVPSPGARDCLEQLRQAGLRLGVGTDMTADWQYAKLERLNLLPLLDFVVTSEEVTQEKPGARFFQLCREKAGCPASACVFVGDNHSKDVEGAKRAGMRPVWYRPHSGPDAPLLVDGVLEVRRLDHLAEYLLSLLGANHEKEDVS